jgi:hypothetical protein
LTERHRLPGAAVSAYWRQVRERALGKPKGTLDWAQLILAPVVSLLLLSYALGRDKALEQLTKTVLFAAGGLLVAVVFAVFRVAKAVFEIHQEDLDNISAIERGQDAKVAAVETKWENKRTVYAASTDGLTKQVQGLLAAREPKFDIVFLPANDDDSRPYVQTLYFDVVVSMGPLKKMRDRRYRIGVQNLSTAVIPGVRVVVAACSPSHNFIHIGHRLAVMDSGDPPQGEGDLTPSLNGEPTLFFDVVNEYSGAGHPPTQFSFCYANPGLAGAMPFSNDRSYEVVLRCEGGGVATERSFVIEKRFKDGAPDRLRMRPL